MSSLTSVLLSRLALDLRETATIGLTIGTSRVDVTTGTLDFAGVDCSAQSAEVPVEGCELMDVEDSAIVEYERIRGV